jgi:transcription-repair coupling factor (superfamily II helicase)
MTTQTTRPSDSALLGRAVPLSLLERPARALASALAGRRATEPVVVAGLHGSAASLLLAAWFREHGVTTLAIAAHREAAQQLADDLETWLGGDDVVYLPQQEVLAFDRKSPDPALVGAYLAGLDRLTSGRPLVAVTSLYGLRQKVIAPAHLRDAVLVLKKGQRRDADDLGAQLAARGYRPAGMVARCGDFARRGGLLDVFSPGEHPLRIEFFDDEIVSLRLFDVETQRSHERLTEVRVVPVSHRLLDDDAVAAALTRLEDAFLSDRIAADEFDELRIRLSEIAPVDGMEAFLPFYGPSALASAYLPADAVLFWQEPVQLGIQADMLASELPRLRESRQQRDPLLPETAELVATPEELAGIPLRQVYLAASWIAGDASGHWLGRSPREILNLTASRPDLKGGDVARLRAELVRREAAGETILFLCDNLGQAQRLAELLDETDGAPLATRPTVGSIGGGFTWPEVKLACLTDHEFFERYRRPTRLRHRTAGVVKDRRAFRTGEHVVHLDYGIGIYRGLRRITVEGSRRECLLIEYAEDGKVYVPVEKIDQIERYSSDSEVQPKLDRLGSASWRRISKRAQKAIQAMAAELIELYAARQALPGWACGPDGHLQAALEDSFLYEETPDQLGCIEDVKRDMESARPMDRLVCGDVGYGKTEVAMRAAFKTVLAGKQVAVLCPTTLLANQHGETFSERFRDFPVRVATLSRFRTVKEQKEIVGRAAEGRLDVLIGTHRLLSRDVRFRDLGLLVIDEEHRFGVRHKERLKELRRLVDVLSLSATPIPRTLYLALMGARDISLINTPPRDRLPVHTELCTFDEGILTEAVLRELHRGGQVFCVHNRIETIENMAALMQELLPGVRIAVAHGRMRESELERIMSDFLNHKFDVLVTTAIIESGLDMPRVNTIIIDRADRFGLAQLYQLRGRVGRSSHRAFAYLMTPPGERLTVEARRRLAALEEFQALGSGYHIAMRDLEIRGSGNLLGTEQHGHMEAIGFELYCRLLEEAVLELKGGGGVAPLDVKVDLRAPAYLPDEYIGDAEQKMDLYRRLARLRELQGCDLLRDEIEDRYGQVPPPVENLLLLQKVRLLAGASGIQEIRFGRNGLDFFFAGDRVPSPLIIRRLLETGPQGLAFQAVDQFIMKRPAARERAVEVALATLTQLARLQEA